jgi:hypothetical protein
MTITLFYSPQTPLWPFLPGAVPALECRLPDPCFTPNLAHVSCAGLDVGEITLKDRFEILATAVVIAVGKTETLGASNLPLFHTRLPVDNSRSSKGPSGLPTFAVLSSPSPVIVAEITYCHSQLAKGICYQLNGFIDDELFEE